MCVPVHYLSDGEKIAISVMSVVGGIGVAAGIYVVWAKIQAAKAAKKHWIWSRTRAF